MARAIGVSNYSPAQIDELIAATGVAPAINQIPWSPADYDADLLAAHREREVVLEGYSPFKRTDLDDPMLAEIAAAHDVTPAQVVAALAPGHRLVVIPKSVNRERIVANAAGARIELTETRSTKIDGLGRIPGD